MYKLRRGAAWSAATLTAMLLVSGCGGSSAAHSPAGVKRDPVVVNTQPDLRDWESWVAHHYPCYESNQVLRHWLNAQDYVPRCARELAAQMHEQRELRER